MNQQFDLFLKNNDFKTFQIDSQVLGVCAMALNPESVPEPCVLSWPPRGGGSNVGFISHRFAVNLPRLSLKIHYRLFYRRHHSGRDLFTFFPLWIFADAAAPSV